MKMERGFLIKKNQKIRINHKKTNSILLNRLMVDFLLLNKQYFKGRLLDAGCGEKPYSLFYDELVESSIGCDVEWCIHEQSQVDVFASIDDMPFEDKSFDTVLCTSVLEHVAETETAFSELCRVIKEGGCLILSIPFLYPVHEAPYDFWRYTVHGIKQEMKKNGMKIEKINPWGGVGMLLMVYCNLFLCKFLKIRILNCIACVIQEIFYELYRLFVVNRIVRRNEVTGISKTISAGYFVIARKEEKKIKEEYER